MSASLSLTEAQTLAALRSFLVGILPAGVEVVRAEVNRVPEPQSADFVVMTPITRARLETNTETYIDMTRAVLQPTEVTVQLDIHGPNSADNTQIVSTLFRDRYACEQFNAANVAVQPLYASEPGQAPFVNGEQQVEYRWTLDVVMQANPVVTTVQQTATIVTVGLIDVDAVYPPGAS